MQKKKNEEFMSQLGILAQDNSTLRDLLSKSSDQIQGLRKSLTTTEQTIFEYQRQIEKNKDQEKIILKLETDLAQYKESMSVVLLDFDKTKTYILQIEGEKSMLAIEIRRLTETLEIKNTEINDLRSKQGGLESKLMELSAIQYMNVEMESQLK